jgi:hypothetical protein
MIRKVFQILEFLDLLGAAVNSLLEVSKLFLDTSTQMLKV